MSSVNPRRFLNCFSCCFHPGNNSPNHATGGPPETKKLFESEVLKTFPVIIYGDSASTASQKPCSYPPFDSGSCSICLAEFSSGETLRVLPRCGHVFHKGCIDVWLLGWSLNCPVCRDNTVHAKPSLESNNIRHQWNENASSFEALNLAGNAHRFTFL